MKLSSGKFLLVFILLIATVSLFTLTRSAEYISRNYVFILDQGRDYIFVRDMVLNKKPTLIGSEIGGGFAGFQGIFQGPFHFYILAIFFLLFNGDPYGGLIYMGIFAILSIVSSYILGRLIFGSIYGLLFAFLIAASPPIIAQAKFVWNPYPVTFFIILSFLFVYLSQKRSRIFLMLSGFFSAFTYNFEIATTIPLVFSILFFYIFIIKLWKIKDYSYVILGILIGILPFLFFEIRHNFIAINGFLKYITEFAGDKNYGLINNHLDRFLYNFQDTFPHQNLLPQSLFLFLFITSFVLVFMNEKRTELKNFILFLGILIFSTVLVFSFLRNSVFSYYIYHLCVVYIFIFVYILYASFSQRKFDVSLLFLILLAIFSAFAYKDGLRDFKNDMSKKIVYQKITGKLEAVDFIYKDARGKPFGLFIFAPPVYTYPYDYLVWWRGKKFGLIPNQDKSGIFYLLIEKDEAKPWTYEGWIKTVIKEGGVLKTKTLPSGLIIEKRCGTNCPE